MSCLWVPGFHVAESCYRVTVVFAFPYPIPEIRENSPVIRGNYPVIRNLDEVNGNDENHRGQGNNAGTMNIGANDEGGRGQSDSERSINERRIIIREPYEWIQRRVMMAMTNVTTPRVLSREYTHGLAQGTGGAPGVFARVVSSMMRGGVETTLSERLNRFRHMDVGQR